MLQKLGKYMLLMGIFVGFAACGGENSTGVGEEEPPRVPEVSQAKPDFSYFKSGAEKYSTLAGEAYSNARVTVFQAEAFISIGPSLFSFFEQARDETAEMEDGKWVWSYSASGMGGSAEVKVTSEVNESAGEAKWVMYLSQSGGSGPELDNFRFMEGTASLDGTSGDWKIYDYSEGDDSSPVFTYTWSIDENDNLEASFDFSSENSVETMTYREEGADHWLVFSGTDSDLEIFWNADEDYGYYWDKSEGNKHCWTSGKENIGCAEINLD